MASMDAELGCMNVLTTDYNKNKATEELDGKMKSFIDGLKYKLEEPAINLCVLLL